MFHLFYSVHWKQESAVRMVHFSRPEFFYLHEPDLATPLLISELYACLKYSAFKITSYHFLPCFSVDQPVCVGSDTQADVHVLRNSLISICLVRKALPTCYPHCFLRLLCGSVVVRLQGGL